VFVTGPVRRRAILPALAVTIGAVLAACSGGGSVSTPVAAVATGTPVAAATAAPTAAPTADAIASEAPASDSTGLTIGSILGDALPAAPPGTTWARITDDAGTFSFEVPSTWDEQVTLPWEEAGTRIGTVVAAGPDVAGIGTDFTVAGVALGIAANAPGSTPRSVVESDDFSASCTGDPVEDASDAGYTAAFKGWSGCGGNTDAFVLVIAIAPAGSTGLIAVVLQGVGQADLGYLEHIMGSLQATGVTPPAGPAVSEPVPASAAAPPGNSQAFTITIDECFLQTGDVGSIGVIRNTDSTSHAYRIRVRFVDEAGIVYAEAEQETPALAPGEAYRYGTPFQNAQGVTSTTCTVVDVQVLG
jgi:hypothetical protein